MSGLSQEEPGTESHKPTFGELVRAQFSADNAWYRAKCQGEVDGEYKVFYVDYGNSETIPASKIRKLPEKFATLKPQAAESHLAYVKPPTLDQDYGSEAAEFLKELVEGKTMMANVEYTDGNQLYLSLGDRESQVHVNGALVRAGLAKVEKIRSKHLQPLISKLKEEEEKARQSHSCIWEYGDPGSDEDEDKEVKALQEKVKKELKKNAPPTKGKESEKSEAPKKDAKKDEKAE